MGLEEKFEDVNFDKIFVEYLHGVVGDLKKGCLKRSLKVIRKDYFNEIKIQYPNVSLRRSFSMPLYKLLDNEKTGISRNGNVLKINVKKYLKWYKKSK